MWHSLATRLGEWLCRVDTRAVSMPRLLANAIGAVADMLLTRLPAAKLSFPGVIPQITTFWL
jgi:hypothetical protein